MPPLTAEPQAVARHALEGFNITGNRGHSPLDGWTMPLNDLDLPERESQQDRDRLLAAWTAFLGAQPWTHAAHLTTRFSLAPEALVREFKAFVRRLERCGQRKVLWIYGMEFAGDRHHLHAVLAVPLHSRDIKRFWRSGNTSITKYNGVNALRYSIKQVRHGESNLDFVLLRPKEFEDA